MTNIAEREVVTVAEVARILGVSRLTAYHLVWDGRLPSFKVGRLIRVRKIDLAEYRKRHPTVPT